MMNHVRRPHTLRWGRLHVLTDTRPGINPIPLAHAALAAGAPVLQVRCEDHYSDRQAFDLALRMVELCDRYQATCLINDRLDVALAVGAHGAHLGDHDLPVSVGRRILQRRAVIGATCRDVHSARAHHRSGATYLGVGPAFAGSTKTGLPPPLGPDGIAEVAAAVDIPVIAIGGVTARTAPELVAAGAYGVAVVAAISRAADPSAATRQLLEVLNGQP